MKIVLFSRVSDLLLASGGVFAYKPTGKPVPHLHFVYIQAMKLHFVIELKALLCNVNFD